MNPEETATAHTSDADPPDTPAGARHGTALCLSGGGYRAALFHLGATRRLNELGILASVTTVSGVSGGSILANLLADPRLEFRRADATVVGFDEYVATPLRQLASRNIRTPAFLAKLKPRNWRAPDAAIRALADELASQFPWWSDPLARNDNGAPEIITGATEIGYGVDWVFEGPSARSPRGRVGDYRTGYAAWPRDLRRADAVAASCAFPPFFSPMVLDGEAMHLRGGRRGVESPGERRGILRRIRLTDGGVYDNLALEPVWKNHATVLVSDGGSVFRARTERTVLGRTQRILAIATSGGQSVRSRWLHASFARGILRGTSWALDTLIDGGYPTQTVTRISAVRTDLDAFSTAEQQILERHGYLVADAQVRTHAPQLIVRDSDLDPPHPAVADPEVAGAALSDSARRLFLGRS
ncbi:patatin-like phospholipase family protein [Nostocoides sp. HKS02]|uniref:patatin-like phospholipase family protein n=1 Tax=Nostocoides sp. HKS02 TaxID=1813880 RepID=UPI0012B4AD58|nr:patatin-like phospholipase family protein [Tetrasphaera sp. HKS02]QGN57692.1 patatin-like phospholipase family protein [Tetrasphaera sp. HKS02]